MHMLAYAFPRTVSHACTARGIYFSVHTQTVLNVVFGRQGPPQKWPSFFFFPLCYLRWRERGNVSGRRKTSKNTVGVGATAEVKQSESCRQSFNLKRTRSPWGARGAGRIKKFNNSMFYGPRKWDLSTGAGWGRWELAVWSRTHTKLPDKKTTKKKMRSATECWVELMTSSPGLKYTAATASWQHRRERGQQIKSCGVCLLSLFHPHCSWSLLSVCQIRMCFGIFPGLLLYFSPVSNCGSLNC